MSYFPVGPANQRSLWQRLLAPMLLASLGLHGLLLLIPVASSDEAAIPAPDPEQDNIAITRIPPAATATAAGSPPVPLPAATGQSVPIPSAPVVATAPQPVAPGRQAAPASSTPARSAPVRPGGRSPQATAPAASAPPTLPSLPAQPGTGEGASPVTVPPPSPSVSTPTPALSPISQDRRETVLAYLSSLDFSPAQFDQLTAAIWQRYGYSGRDTSRGEYTTNLNQWQAQIQGETGQADLVAEEDRTNFEVSFARRACLTRPPGEVKVGFVVNPDGSFRQEPVLLRSSGYAELNQKALEVVRRYEPPAADQIRAYTVTVETAVDYGKNECLAPLQQPSGTSTET